MRTHDFPPGTIGSLLAAARPPRGTAASHGGPPEHASGALTVTDCLERVVALAAGLVEYGAQAGDRIAILAPDGIGPLLAELAAQCAGLVVVPLDPGIPDGELRRALEETEARLALVSDQQALGRILAIRPDLPALDLVLLFEPPTGERAAPATMVDQAERLGRQRLDEDPSCLSRMLSSPRPGTQSRWNYTLKTERRPRRVQTHGNLVHAVGALADALPLKPEDRVLVGIPMRTSAARALQCHALASGATLLFPPATAPLGAALSNSRPTVVVALRDAVEDWAVRTRAVVFGGSWPARALAGWAIGRNEMEFDAARSERRIPKSSSARSRLVNTVSLKGSRRVTTGGALRSLVSIGAPLDDGIARFLFSYRIACFEAAMAEEVVGLVSVSGPGFWNPGTAGRPVPGLDVEATSSGFFRFRGPMVSTAGSESPRDWVESSVSGAADESGYLRLT